MNRTWSDSNDKELLVRLNTVTGLHQLFWCQNLMEGCVFVDTIR